MGFWRWYHGWNVVATCVVAGMSAVALTINCSSLFMPDWTRAFDAPVSTIGLGLTLFSLLMMILSYWVGIAAARYPARWLYGGGLLCLGVAHILIALAHQIWQFLAIYALLLPFALGFTGSIPSQALVSRWFARRVGLAMGFTAVGLALSRVNFSPIIVALLPAVGWRVLWGSFGALILLVILPSVMLSLRDRPDCDDPSDYISGVQTEAADRRVVSSKEVLQHRNFWLILTAFLSVQFIPFTLYINITPIIESYGGTAKLSGLFLSAFSIAALCAMLTAGWLSDRIGNRIPLATATLTTGVGTILLAVPNVQPAHILAVAVLLGSSGAVWTLLASSLLAEFGPISFSRAYGLGCAAAPLVSVAPPAVAGLEELTGSYANPLIVLGVTAAVASLAVFLLFSRQASAMVPVQA